jgi:hypothetical protein
MANQELREAATAAPGAGLVDLAALERTPVAETPFQHLLLPRFLAEPALSAVIADYPATPGPGAHPVGDLVCAGAFQGLLDALLGPEFEAAIERKFGVELKGLPTFCTVRGFCGPRDGRVHTDTPDKVITVLLYPNQSWEPSGGRLRLLNGRGGLDDPAVEAPPDGGTLLIFRRSAHSWHGHLPFVGPRRVIQLNWITRRDFVAFKNFRLRAEHALSRMAGRK